MNADTNWSRSSEDLIASSPMLVMEGMLAAIAEFIKLLERSEKRSEVVFTKFVEDLFKEFEPVARDYVALFERLANAGSAAKSPEEFRDAFRQFVQGRETYELVRRRIEALAAIYQEKIDRDDIESLFKTIETFFSAGTGRSDTLRLRQAFEGSLGLLSDWRAKVMALSQSQAMLGAETDTAEASRKRKLEDSIRSLNRLEAKVQENCIFNAEKF